MSASRGEVRTLGGRKVAVLSADTVSAGTGRPWCAPIVRHTPVPSELAVFAVPTHEADPVTGVLLLLEMGPVPAEQLGDPVGTLVGATLARVEDGVRALFDMT